MAIVHDFGRAWKDYLVVSSSFMTANDHEGLISDSRETLDNMANQWFAREKPECLV
jgi:hypothetical protein